MNRFLVQYRRNDERRFSHVVAPCRLQAWLLVCLLELEVHAKLGDGRVRIQLESTYEGKLVAQLPSN